jgi:DNA-directed RNA polymerase specialized sigma24 family protein
MQDQHPKRQPSAPELLQSLCAAAAAGDASAFEAIHRRLGGGLKRLFLERSGGRADLAEELSQRTWVAVWQALTAGKYDPSRAAISTFVYAVGSKIWLGHLRGSQRDGARAAGGEGAFYALVRDDGPGDVAAGAELIQAVRDCLAGVGADGGLTPDERALVCAAAAGESDRALAKRLKLAPSTVNARKRAAYEKLRRWLAQRGHRPESSERGAGVNQ